MEVVAGVASFVSLALTSAHGIHRALSGIQQAPRTAQRLLSAISNLSNLLEQLEACQDDLCRTSNLDALLDQCAKDLGELEAKLVKPSAVQGSRLRRLRRNFMIMLNDREWDSGLAMIRQHQASLSLQLQVITG